MSPIQTQIESVIIPSTSFCLPPLITQNQILFFSKKVNHEPTNENIIHIFELESEEWRRKYVPNISNPNQISFCLLYENYIALLILELTSVESRSANVVIYKLTNLKENSSWEKIPFTNENLMPIDLSSCQCAQSNRNVVLASVCQPSTLVVHVHQYSSQHSWINLSFLLQTTTNPSYELQSCAIARHTLYCSLSCTERNAQRKVTIYKIDLDHAIDNNEERDLKIVHDCTSSVLCCHLCISNASSHGQPITVNMIANNSNKCYNLEVCPLNDNSIKLFQKHYELGTKLLSAVNCNNNVTIVYYDSSCDKWYLEVFPITYPKK